MMFARGNAKPMLEVLKVTGMYEQQKNAYGELEKMTGYPRKKREPRFIDTLCDIFDKEKANGKS